MTQAIQSTSAVLIVHATTAYIYTAAKDSARKEVLTMAEYINRERARFEAKRYFKNMDEIQEDLDMLFCMLPAENVAPVQKWISVKDELPEYPGHYLVCTSINYWHGGCMDINENHKAHPNGTPVGYDGTTMSVLDCYYDVTGHWNRVCDSHVTHWMPIPEPPKGE